MFDTIPHCRLATLPTPFEAGPEIGDSIRLWVKRDDLTGLGLGGNKARKLEFLCGAAVAAGASSLVTVGAAQSNHCRMTAAAGAILGLDVHLVLSGDRPDTATGNQLLSALFGAQLHFTGAHESHWGELEIAREALVDQLAADGESPYSIPIGGSTPIGAIGYAHAFGEIMRQCEEHKIEPTTIVHTTSSGGTHAGLLAGRAVHAALGHPVPDILAIGVAKGVNMGLPDIVAMANDALDLIDHRTDARVAAHDVFVDADWLGDDYAVPTEAGDDAIGWAARAGGWVLDRVYTGKGMSGLLGNAAQGRWSAGSDVVFIHTGGTPSVFADGGVAGRLL